MIWIQRRRYKKYKNVYVRGFHNPYGLESKVVPEGKIVGYGKRQLIVKMINCKGFPIENIKSYNWIDPMQEVNELGYWFISYKELKDSLKADAEMFSFMEE